MKFALIVDSLGYFLLLIILWTGIGTSIREGVRPIPRTRTEKVLRIGSLRYVRTHYIRIMMMNLIYEDR
jgi:hypothetical protein